MPFFYSATWQEMLASLPPAEQAELLALLSGHAGDERGEDEPADDTP
jgi:hypothetical protein